VERQNRLLTILAVILLVLVAVLVLSPPEAGDEATVDDDAPPQSKLFDYKRDDISVLALDGPHGEIRFEKGMEGWRMTRPREAAVDDTKLTSIIDRFETLKIEDRTLEGKAEDYGLDAEHRVDLRMEKPDGAVFSVIVGKDTTVGYRTYAARADGAPAQLLSSKVADLVQKAPDDFRSKRLLDFSPTSVRRIRIVDGSAELVLRKSDHGWWIGDNGPRADGDKVGDWIAALSGAQAERFLDGQSPGELGLDHPPALLAVEDDGGTHTLKLGARDHDGANAIAGDVPVRVATEDLEKLLVTTGYLSPLALEVKAWMAQSLEVQLGDRSLVASRKEGEWVDATGAPVGKVDELLDAIAKAGADRSGTPAFSGNWGRIAVGLGGDKGEVVSIGDSLPGGGRVARDEAGGPPFRIDDATLAALASSF